MLQFTPRHVTAVASCGFPQRASLSGVSTTLAPVEAARVELTLDQPILQRTHDAATVQAFVNHPDVLPFVGASDPLDMADAVANDGNTFLVGDHGGFALIPCGPAAMEVHTFITPAGRGKWAYAAADAMIDAARDAGATTLRTLIRPDMGNVASFARHFGMKRTGAQIETLGHAYDAYEMEVSPCR